MDADDTARAPMAKAILQSKELPWPMEIGSRGLVVLFPQPVNQKVEAVLARNGLSAKDHTGRYWRIWLAEICSRRYVQVLERVIWRSPELMIIRSPSFN